MLRTIVLSLLLFVSLSSTSLLRKSISRRQVEPEYCQAIEGFDCKCSEYRVTCTSDRVLPRQINVLQNARQKYPSVELIINGEHEQNVYEYTFEPVQQLYKTDIDNFEFRIKFEKFTALHLAAPGIFNRVFPDQLPATARKHLALEIYNPLIQPEDNVNLFANLNVDSLELFVLYPFRGTFQQLFNGANIKFLRLSGGDIRSDLSQPFTGNIGRLELAKQASQINTQNFPIYPAHELIINAFYVNDFNSDNPPNYSNLGELRVYAQERIPANAFRAYPNLHTLSITTEKDIDPHALDGLYNLEKLTIKDAKPSLELLNSLHNLKELEVSPEKLNDQEQCQLAEKLANGQIAVQAVSSARECTCISAYLDSAAGRHPCDAPNCDQSSCAAIKNNYNAEERSFKTPPAIKRADGSDALRPRESKLYNGPYQISNQDREKSQQGASQQQQQQQQQQPSGQEGEEQEQPDSATVPGQTKKSRRTRPRGSTTLPTGDPSQWQPDQQDYQLSWKYQSETERHSSVIQNESQQEYSAYSDEIEVEKTEEPWDYPDDYESDKRYENDDPDVPQGETNQGETNPEETGEPGTSNEGGENQQDGDGNQENQGQNDVNKAAESVTIDDNEYVSPAPPKKGLNWLPIIIISASIAALLLIGLIVLVIRKKRSAGGYTTTATTDTAVRA